jgi:hypothetical protein
MSGNEVHLYLPALLDAPGGTYASLARDGSRRFPRASPAALGAYLDSDVAVRVAQLARGTFAAGAGVAWLDAHYAARYGTRDAHELRRRGNADNASEMRLLRARCAPSAPGEGVQLLHWGPRHAALFEAALRDAGVPPLDLDDARGARWVDVACAWSAKLNRCAAALHVATQHARAAC